jgi:hypothetical protein
MARFRLSGINLRKETGRHEGLPRNERSCCQCKRLLGEDLVAPIADEEHLLFSCDSTKDITLRFADLPMSSLRNLMQCERESSLHVRTPLIVAYRSIESLCTLLQGKKQSQRYI